MGDAIEGGIVVAGRDEIKNLTWQEAKEYMRRGKIVRHDSWSGYQNLWIMTGSEIAKQFSWGFGEMVGEPYIQDTYVYQDKKNRIHFGKKPPKSLRKDNDWIVCGTWTDKR
ncbi:hypothetical protein FP73_gp099 [Bacillus phage Hoody T]|uniref:Uncharacterized protein n=1 Tax=Bacillus phage Hoody T TaxID=1486660 RepID=A0A024B1P5_9CAUD|nr:hypothetical protein FP73_gp099 [Bacillus phage Hoody T]AHZ10554.1 hypothetical protein [Bacillus phage Hoody T]